VTIPDWTTEHLLPPVRPGEHDADRDRSPYRCTLLDVVRRLGVTPERRSILMGLLEYRQALRDAGVLTGFQWLNGSFVEDIEAREKRPPHDVDVVTFLAMGDKATQQERLKKAPMLFARGMRHVCKATYSVDGYLVDLGFPPRLLVHETSYWYSMWSHRRGDKLWKGFVQIELDAGSAQDAEAKALLSTTAPSAS
jgi:hypothetical protein